MTFSLHRTTLLIIFEVWWIAFMVLLKTPVAETWLGVLVASFSLLLLPGIATFLNTRIRVDFWTYMTFALGISIVELLLIALGANAVLPYVGIERPLDVQVLAPLISIFVVGCMVAQWMRGGFITFEYKRFVIFETSHDLLLALVPSFFVVMSIIGAIVLNNGGSGMLTYVMLWGIVIYSIVLIWYADDAGENVVPTALFCIALALLLMTSLRSWYITGHDIQREFQVFQLAHTAGLWSIERFKDAYNACLSITLLPTILAEFTRVNDVSIFKTFFQVCFATVPAMLFIILRRMVRPGIAVLASLYFVAFPTFFSDMPFLNRQEIAFVFLFLMFLALTDERLSIIIRRGLFMLFGLGMIVSHYSTTYTVVAILIFSTCAMIVARVGAPYVRRLSFVRDSGVAALRGGVEKSRITVLMVIVLASMSILWSSVLTDTSSNSLYRVVAETARALGANSGEETRSNDVLYGLFSRHSVQPSETVEMYKNTIVAPRRTAEPDAYFSDDVVSTYPVSFSPPQVMPLTSLGKAFESIGIDVQSFNTAIRQSSAKLLQILMIIGFAAIWIQKKYLVRPLDTEWVTLMSASVFMLVVITGLPVLSAEYGLLRAFQQSLLFLGMCIVIGSLTMFKKLGEHAAYGATAALTILFMISSTGLITQALGGYSAQLHLNNAGTEYDLYYMHRGEIVGTAWLLREMQSRDVSIYQSGLAINVLSLLPESLTNGIESLKTIYPDAIRKQSYVLIGEQTLKEGRGSLVFNGDVLIYDYPRAFLDENKNMIYNNGSVAVYH